MLLVLMRSGLPSCGNLSSLVFADSCSKFRFSFTRVLIPFTRTYYSIVSTILGILYFM